MIYLNQTYELLVGGFHSGNKLWNKQHTEIDNCFKLYQLTEGSIHVCSDNEDFTLEKGKMYFINGSKLSKQYCEKSFSTYWIHFLPKDLMIFQSLMEFPVVLEINTNNISLISIEKNINILLKNTEISSWEYTLSILHVQTLIQNVITELIKMCNMSAISNRIYILEPAIHYIHSNYKNNINLRELACMCNISTNYFHRMFKQAFKTTPANYIILLKMNSALQLLKDNNITMKEIAFELGFTDNAHFCKTFKKYYGITPKEYQKNPNILR